MPPLLVILLLPTAPAGGEVRLHWRAPEPCPSAESILDDVGSLTGRPLAEGPPRLVVSATVTSDPWRGTFSARSAAGASHRELVGETCDAVARAAAVIMAIALADVRRMPIWAPLPDPPRRPQPAVLTLSPIETRWPLRVRLDGYGGAQAGVFPSANAEAAVGVALTRDRLRGRLEVFWRWGPDQPAEGRTLGYQGAGTRIEGCWVHPRRGWELDVCGGLELGAWWVRDRARDRVFTNPWVTPIAGVGGRWRLGGPLWVGARGGLGVPVVRSEIQVSTRENRPELNVTVFQPEPVHPWVRIGVGGRFW